MSEYSANLSLHRTTPSWQRPSPNAGLQRAQFKVTYVRWQYWATLVAALVFASCAVIA